MTTPVVPTGDTSLASRPRTFLVAKDDQVLAPASAGPLDFGWLAEQLDAHPDVEVARRIRPSTFRAQVLGTSITDEVVVATMSDAVADEVRRHPQVVLEEDLLLTPARGTEPVTLPDPGLLSPFGTSTTWDLTLRGRTGTPVAGATVYLYGAGVPAQGRTDAAGQVSLSLSGESDATLRALYVNPQSDYWSLWVNRPTLTSGTANVVTLEALADTVPGFPSVQTLGWGQRAMRLDHLPPTLTGHGVKVAVVDSGAAVLTHPDLAAITAGVDLTGGGPTAWTVDTIAHGSHCSGVVAGADNGGGVRGFAPQAEVHEARIFPGGRISSLLDAVDYCIEHEIDVVNMSLGTGGESQILLQKIAQAKDLGVACVVAAGNTGGPVQFPGSSPEVLTVAAIGQEGTFPETSYHAQQRWTQGNPDGSYFSAQFSCHGPEVDVAGPGVAVISSVPDRGFASWDGTSMATPHVTGLAALVLAHHPDFVEGGTFRLRTAERVERLFALLTGSCTPLAFGDTERSGRGLPDAVRALGLDGPPAKDDGPAAQAAVSTALAQLAQQMGAAGLAVDPQQVPPPPQPSPVRAMAELRAQLVVAGLALRAGAEAGRG